METATQVPARPTRKTADLTKAINAISEQIHQWCNEDTALDQINEDVKSILKIAWDFDGYELAKELEAKYYTPDRELVEILDGVHWMIRRCVTDAEKEWVTENNIQPLYDQGQTIAIPGSVIREEGDMQGTITEVDTETGRYTINIPELGHVKPGELGTTGRVLKFEDLHRI